MRPSRTLLSLVVLTLCVGAAPALCRAADEVIHVEAAHHDPMATDPLTVDPDLAIWSAIVFLLLLAVLTKFAWRPISEALDNREQSIAAQIQAAERSNEEARRLLSEYQQQLSGVHDEVRAIIEEAKRDAEHTQQEIISRAHSEAEAFRDRARRDIDSAKAQALKELSEASAKQAVELAGRILRSELDAGRHAQLVEEALGRFPQGNPSQN